MLAVIVYIIILNYFVATQIKGNKLLAEEKFKNIECLFKNIKIDSLFALSYTSILMTRRIATVVVLIFL